MLDRKNTGWFKQDLLICKPLFKTSLGCRLLAVLEIGPEKFQTFPQGMSEDLGLLRVAAEKRGQGSSIKILNHDGWRWNKIYV